MLADLNGGAAGAVKLKEQISQQRVEQSTCGKKLKPRRSVVEFEFVQSQPTAKVILIAFSAFASSHENPWAHGILTNY